MAKKSRKKIKMEVKKSQYKKVVKINQKAKK